MEIFGFYLVYEDEMVIVGDFDVLIDWMDMMFIVGQFSVEICFCMEEILVMILIDDVDFGLGQCGWVQIVVLFIVIFLDYIVQC